MRKKKTKPILIIITVVLLSILIVAGFKLYEVIERKIDEHNYPLEYSEEVYKYSEIYDVPPSVIFVTIKVESGFSADALSGAGACGLMQLMPDTFSWLASTLGEEVSENDIFDPSLNIKYGTYYLATLYQKLGDWNNVYAAYNAGIGRVNEWLGDPRYSQDGVLTDIPYKETRNHVAKLVYAREKYIELYKYGE